MKEIIQRTPWSLSKEISENFSRLCMMRFTDTSFVYGEERLSITHYVSSPSAWAQEFLENLFIGSVYSLYGHYDRGDEYPKYDLIIDLSEFRKNNQFIQLDSHHHTITIEDNGMNFPELVEQIRSQDIFKKINQAREARKKVLINCQMGMSRSATLAILYMMETYGVSLVQAYRYLQRYRPIVEPNPGYFAALHDHEANLTVEPPPFEAAKSWLNEFVSNPDLLRVEEKEDSVILRVTRETGELGSAFIDLISFLRMNHISVTLLNCDGRIGEVCISSTGYKTLQTLLENKIIGVEKLNEETCEYVMLAMNEACDSLNFQVSNSEQKEAELTKLRLQLSEHHKNKQWDEAFESVMCFIVYASKPTNGLNFYKTDFGQTPPASIFYQSLERAGLIDLVAVIKHNVECRLKEQEVSVRLEL
ncbi:dual specificity protein phosphatase family protein [Legionella maceachernii]|uniref:Phosphoprotein phosphatase n=1 Tax=Legionella maceachernii TaxID=466 RepID=A0A0W0VYJ7_9GAMM|nr:dual specificity protein phosphatase [Legionella maceachernii]KTD25195.1 Phosphoprotein phosphatase [Legionella maceachernii]SJZ76132.1 Dual specificity phosphatase, catalytic domain [Legionella maceachernii]SUP03142.1 Predicted protein tyrosine phosphatase [Legionella maceachernii]